MNDVEIRKATKKDAETVFLIISKCGDWLSNEKGLHHWKNSVAAGLISVQTILKSIEKDEVFLILNKRVAVGTITISRTPPSYYATAPWIFWKKELPAVYLKKLAMLPSHHSKGFASKLLKFAEDKAKKEGVKLLRFDAVADYGELTNFYLKRGFTLLGAGVTKHGTKINFFEKQIGG